MGKPRAWYCRQSHSENGESRPTCHLTVRSQKTCSSCSGAGSSRTTENAASVVTTNAAMKRGEGRRSGYVAHSGATMSVANLLHPESAPKTPRPTGDDASQKP